MHFIQMIPIYIDIEEMHDNKVSLSQCGHGDQSYLVWTLNTSHPSLNGRVAKILTRELVYYIED